MRSIKITIYILIVIIFYSCINIPDIATKNVTKIKIGFGPEDIVLDTNDYYKRIITGCDSRREAEKMESNIYYYDIDSAKTGILIRKEEPDDLIFHPHGLDLIIIDSVKYLYVINHRDDISKHQVIKYEVQKNELIFNKIYENKLYNLPNDICVFKDGSFWITNDAGKRNSLAERIFKLKRSTIVYTNIDSYCSVVAKNLAYANGITYKNNFLYVSTTMQGKIFRYNIAGNKLTGRKEICNIKGGDNLTWSGDDLIVASHQNFIAFMKHAKNSSNISPSVIYQINPENGSHKIVYSNSGNQISAASTAILFNGNLYISQVFDPFILKAKME